MKKWSLISSVFSPLLAAFSIQAAVPEACVESISRVKACPNMVYRGVTDEATGKAKMFCFCKADMLKLFAKNVSEEQKMLNKMELRELLAKFNYTEQQLLNLIKN